MLTQDEIERRRRFITATDVPKLFGRSPWGSAADVFWDKVGTRRFTGNAATEAGTLLEPSVIAWAHQQLGGVVSGDWRVHENGINACSLDAMTIDGEPVEAKTTGIVGPGTPHQWGDEGTDEIPEYYLLQVHAQLAVTGAPRAWVPALIGGRGFVMYRVQASPAINEAIARVSEQFWREHIEQNVQPEGCIPTLETMKGIRRTPGKEVAIADELAADYLEKQAVAAAAAKDADQAKAALIAALADAETGAYSGGKFTFAEQTRKGYTIEETTFRVLRHKVSKKGLVTV